MNLGLDIEGANGFIEGIDDLEDDFAQNVSLEVYTNVDYAYWQEFGTSFMEGTPHLRPGFRAALGSLDDFIEHHTTRRALMLLAIEVVRETMRRAPVDTGHLRASYDWRWI